MRNKKELKRLHTLAGSLEAPRTNTPFINLASDCGAWVKENAEVYGVNSSTLPCFENERPCFEITWSTTERRVVELATARTVFADVSYRWTIYTDVDVEPQLVQVVEDIRILADRQKSEGYAEAAIEQYAEAGLTTENLADIIRKRLTSSFQ